MPRLLIIDTNVFIVGLISSQTASPMVRIVDAMLSGGFVYVLSPALLKEYRDVLMRPKICKLHGLSQTEADQLLTEIIANAVWHEPASNKSVPDPGDHHLWDLLEQSKETILVTGDRLLLDNPPQGSSGISPATCVEEFSQGTRSIT